MKLKPSLLFFSFLGIVGIAFFVERFDLFGAQRPNPEKEAVLVRTLVDGLERLHFQPKPVDDDLSGQVYDLYLKNIDAGKRFFIQKDIDQFAPYGTQLDEAMESGNLDFFNLTIEAIDRNLVKTQGWYREILAKPLDFTSNDLLETKGEKIAWAKDDAELRARWVRWMKYEVLYRITEEQEKQAKPDFKGDKKSLETLEAESRQKVLEVYDRRFKQMQKMSRDRRLEIYLNTITNVFDPHTGYFSPQERETFDIQMSGKLEGIGARLQSDGEKTSVTEIVPGGPAWKQGELQPKDVVLKVGQENAEPVDVMNWDIDDVVSKIRGPKGTRVSLTIQKPDGTVKDIVITRDVVIMEEGFAKSLILRSNPASEDKVGYIYLPKFYADQTPQGLTSCATDVGKELGKLKAEGVKGIILDLRNNGGGSLRDVVRMSGLFIERGPIVQVKGRSRDAGVEEDFDPRVQYAGPLIVMVNGYSASASEILAAAMQDYGRAVIVGSAHTYGKGSVQRFFDLDSATGDDSVKPLGSMKITVQKFYRVTGKTNQLEGVTPDIVLPDFYNLLDNGERENDYPLQANTIEAVPFSQNVYRINDMPQLRNASATRVAADPTFKLVSDNAARLRKQEEQTQYPLQAEKYRMWNQRQKEEGERFEHIFKPIDGFVINNLEADLAQIQSDTSRAARNTDWIQDKQKDIQLYETLRIMQDMIRIDALAAGKQ